MEYICQIFSLTNPPTGCLCACQNRPQRSELLLTLSQQTLPEKLSQVFTGKYVYQGRSVGGTYCWTICVAIIIYVCIYVHIIAIFNSFFSIPSITYLLLFLYMNKVYLGHLSILMSTENSGERVLVETLNLHLVHQASVTVSY